MTSLSRRHFAVGAASAIAYSRISRAANDLPPTIYVGHGSPRLAIDPVRGAELRAWGASLPPVRGVVAITPHYRSRGLRIGHVGKGHGQYSFPAHLRAGLPNGLDYASPDNTELAGIVRDLLAPLEPTMDEERTGFDHTTWMPLMHLLPKADVPVVEVAMPFTREQDLLALGHRLALLRHSGVLIMASGSATHNLASIDIAGTRGVTPWAEAFDAWFKKTLAARDVPQLIDWRARAPSAWLAHPDDGAHYRVMLVALGATLSGMSFDSARFPVEGFELSIQSKRCVELR